jgi:hypothetical protein
MSECQTILKSGKNKGKPCGKIKCKRHNPDDENNAVQSHGFIWEKEILMNVYGANETELKKIKYNSKVDLPAEFNRLDLCDIQVKTSGDLNTVCMADCLRLYDVVGSANPLHLVVIHYTQKGSQKIVGSIVEVDLASSREILFGSLTREEISDLIATIKSVGQNKKPTESERAVMYEAKGKLEAKSGVIRLDIKCNSTQSRLQCSFNRWKKFLVDHKDRIIAASDDHNFRGGTISSPIDSPQRVFKRRQ